MFKKLWHRYVELPTVVELGVAKNEALPSEMFHHEDNDYTWEKHYRVMKMRYPFRYWLNQTLPTYFWPVKRYIADAWYWLQCHLLPSYKFHLIDIRQPKDGSDPHPYRSGWIDSDNKMLLAIFKILCDHVEGEEPLNVRTAYTPEQIVEYGLEDQAEHYDELMTLYNWWKVGRAKHLQSINDIAAIASAARKNKDKKYNALMQSWIDADNLYQEIEEEMLIRVILIRKGMWT